MKSVDSVTADLAVRVVHLTTDYTKTVDVSSEQQQAMDAYVDALDLMSACTDELDDPMEVRCRHGV